jgi:hypothetical protein
MSYETSCLPVVKINIDLIVVRLYVSCRNWNKGLPLQTYQGPEKMRETSPFPSSYSFPSPALPHRVKLTREDSGPVSQDWASSAEGARIEAPRRVGQGAPCPAGGESAENFVFSIWKCCILVVLRYYNLKLDTGSLPGLQYRSHGKRMVNFNAYLTQKK